MRKVATLGYRGAKRVQTAFPEESLTIQSDAHLADINNIMHRFAQDGLEALDQADFMFADVSEFTDLKDAMDQARIAEVEFMKLPSKVREVFDHDVAVWLDTAHDEDKRDALVEAGFIKRVEMVPAVSQEGGPPGVETPPEASRGGAGATPE